MGAGKSKGKKGEAPKVAKKSSAFAGNSFDDKVEEMVNQIKAAKGTTSRKDTYVRHATYRWTQSRCLFPNRHLQATAAGSCLNVRYAGDRLS